MSFGFSHSITQSDQKQAPLIISGTSSVPTFILLLGCEPSSQPLVQYLNSHGYKMKIVAQPTSLSTTDSIIKQVKHPKNISVHKLNIASKTDIPSIEQLLNDCAIVICLLPTIYHLKIAQMAFKYKTHFFTTSLMSNAMIAFNEEILSRILLFVYECGFHPGLCDMIAAKIADKIHANHGLIRSSIAIHGRLPAISNKSSNGFLWSVRDVLLSDRNSKNYQQLIDGKLVNTKFENLFESRNIFVDNVPSIGDVQWCYDSTSVSGRNMHTIIKGRYLFPQSYKTLKAMVDLNLTSIEYRSSTDQTFNEYFRSFLKIVDNETFALAIARILNIEDIENSVVIENLESMDFLSNERIPGNIGQTPLEILRYICFQKLKNCRNEKDLSLLKHTFEVEYSSDGWRETIEVVLVDYGLQINEYSSMARTFSLPLAITVRAFLEGKIITRGVVRPLQPEFYEEILNEMKELNIRFEEKTLPPLIWMRDEIKPGERRCPITPVNCLKLIQAGFQITVECSDNRCIADEEYERVGCTMVDSQSWITQAPYSAFILGIKELSEDDPLVIRHRHIYFAHCFKGQSEAIPLLKRFAAGNGEILDLEYLVNENGRRVAAFGRPAGMVGMAMGIIAWCKQVLDESFDEIEPFENERSMVEFCRQLLKKSVPLSIRGQMPAVMIMGALGRCGKGCMHIAKLVGVTEITAWDLKETRSAGPGPYSTIVNDHEIFVNCIRLEQKIAPFLTIDMCEEKSRRLTVVSDVACDASNVNNPVAVYNEITSMVHPVRRIHVNGNAMVLDVTAIDHLPSLIPLESSEQYSDDLIGTLLDLKNRESPIWQRARDTFYEHSNSYQ